MPASAGTESLTTAESAFFVDATGATAVLVGVDSGEANGALIHIPNLHADGEFFPIAAGKEYIFRLFDCGIRSIIGKGDGGSTEIYFGVVAKT